jgi:O-antigen/teichoic acid export membrane protein
MLDPQDPILNADPPTSTSIQNPKSKIQNPARRVALNALNPFAAQVVTRLLMLAYTIVQFRLIAGESLGGYILATILFSYTSTISEWGLGTLVARDVAKSRGTDVEIEQASTLFSQALTLRLLISLALFIPIAIFTLVYLAFFNLRVEGAWAIAILTLSLLPSAFSGSVTALFYAYERMSLPALIGVATSGVNVLLGVTALYLGLGVIGLAFAAFITTLLTALIFLYLLRRHFPHFKFQISNFKSRNQANLEFKIQNSKFKILSSGWPLMLNALLVGLFFRADQFIIQASTSGLEVARYDAAYRFLNFALLITPAVTLALFPRMARHAASDRPRLLYEYTFALKALTIISVPLVGLTFWFAPLLIAIATGGKPGYQPESTIALQILIFFLPLSFINGITQYVLIALDRQRLITGAFAITVIFNFAANLLLVPLIGINGAALATVLSEVVLLVPFMAWTRRELGQVNFPSIALKPLLSGIGFGLLTWFLWSLLERWSASAADFSLYIMGGLALLAIYVLLLTLLKPFSEAELTGLKGALRR